MYIVHKAAGLVRRQRICKEEVMVHMKSEKAAAPDGILVVVWACLGGWAVDFLTRFFTTFLEKVSVLTKKQGIQLKATP